MKQLRIALAGNPNCGKTTLFNALTGSSQYVGNWPGVTVEKKGGRLKGHPGVTVEDLPGLYSLSPYTLEEVVSRDYLLNERPDVIIDLVDGSNLERNLYLTTQLCEIGIPVVIALNMIDLVRRNGDQIDTGRLSAAFGCEVIETSALRGTGVAELTAKAVEVAESSASRRPTPMFGQETEAAIGRISELIRKQCEPQSLRWYAVKAFERDEKVMRELNLSPEAAAELEAIISETERKLDDDSESIITNERYEFIERLLNDTVRRKERRGHLTASDRIDRVVTNRWLALPIFAAVMWAVYYLSIQTVGTMGTDWVNDVLFGDWIPGATEKFLAAVGCAEWLQSLILDGIIAGVGAVLGFLPQMIVLFFCLALLEDCGYMARVAFIMDRIFHKFGLSGKSFIPMLVATGCGVPGIMASRTIENDKDRRMTVMVTTFIPCSAKLPIIALIAGAFFPESSWIAPSCYFIGIGAVIFSGVLLKKTPLFEGEPAPFVMELPAYHVPGGKNVTLQVWDRSKAFVRKAGTVIFVACVGVWFLSSFNFRMQMVEENRSMLAAIGGVLAPLFSPLGWGDWRAVAASITGLIAKENLVGTCGILYGNMAEVSEDGAEVWPQLQAAFTQVSAFSFMVFNLLCAPCFAAIGAIRREMGSDKWTLIAVGYQCLLAYAAAFLIYQIGAVLFLGSGFGIGQVIALIVLAAILWQLFRPLRKKRPEPIAVETAAAGE